MFDFDLPRCKFTPKDTVKNTKQQLTLNIEKKVKIQGVRKILPDTFFTQRFSLKFPKFVYHPINPHIQS